MLLDCLNFSLKSIPLNGLIVPAESVSPAGQSGYCLKFCNTSKEKVSGK